MSSIRSELAIVVYPDSHRIKMVLPNQLGNILSKLNLLGCSELPKNAFIPDVDVLD